MPWSDQANRDMEFVKSSAQATPQQMSRLLSQMSAWASANRDGRHYIEFGKLRNHGVSFDVRAGTIIKVDYGDR